MEVILAKTAGFCFGVERILNFVENAAKSGNVYTLGPVIHNKIVTEALRQRGVVAIESLDEVVQKDALVVIRSHGVPPAVYTALEASGLRYADYTCPFVRKIHLLVAEDAAAGRGILVLGDRYHPEVVGILGHAGADALVAEDETVLSQLVLTPSKPYTVVAQTTFSTKRFDLLVNNIKIRIPDAKIVNTICGATRERQEEADRLSREVDVMLVIGDRGSSNTRKLYETCKKNQDKSFFIETIAEIELKSVSSNDRIGITAGASTPPAIIKEALLSMSEYEATVGNESFEEMLNESFVTLHTGDIVKGTVIQVANGEVSVNLGYKSDGLIQRGQYSDDPDVDPAAELKEGDEIEVFVVRVNDGDGNVLLSKKRVDSQKGMAELEEAAESGAIINGKITEVVKGGVIAIVNGARAFVPSSQVSNRYVEDLSTFKGKEFDFKILEFDKAKRRIVAGRKELASKEADVAKEKVFATIEIGVKMEGVVSRIADFGAFIDLGGVDGLVHISQLSWGRVKKVVDVLKEGQAVTVTVLDVDKEKGKISLTMKDAESNPWYNVDQKYAIGSVVEGKVVRMVSFGAFVELETGVDGLVHISQIADKHVVKPEDELKIGQIIQVKITDIDLNSQKISLSKKAAEGVMGGADVEEDAAVEEPVAEDVAVVEDVAVEEAVAEEAAE